MKFLIMFLFLILLLAGGYFLFFKYYKTANQNPTATQNVNCTQGLEGNAGDNFCSNYHAPSSKCLPRTENTYPDGCTK